MAGRACSSLLGSASRVWIWLSRSEATGGDLRGSRLPGSESRVQVPQRKNDGGTPAAEVRSSSISAVPGQTAAPLTLSRGAYFSRLRQGFGDSPDAHSAHGDGESRARAGRFVYAERSAIAVETDGVCKGKYPVPASHLKISKKRSSLISSFIPFFEIVTCHVP